MESFGIHQSSSEIKNAGCVSFPFDTESNGFIFVAIGESIRLW